MGIDSGSFRSTRSGNKKVSVIACLLLHGHGRPIVPEMLQTSTQHLCTQYILSLFEFWTPRGRPASGSPTRPTASEALLWTGTAAISRTLFLEPGAKFRHLEWGRRRSTRCFSSSNVLAIGGNALVAVWAWRKDRVDKGSEETTECT